MDETFSLSFAVVMMVSGVVGIALHRVAAENWVPGLARLGIRIDARIPSWCAIAYGSFVILATLPTVVLALIQLDEYTLSGRRAQFSYVQENWGAWMMWVALVLLVAVVGSFWGGAVMMARIEQPQWEWIPFGKRMPSRSEARDLLLGMLLLTIGTIASMGLVWLLMAKSLADALLP